MRNFPAGPEPNQQKEAHPCSGGRLPNWTLGHIERCAGWRTSPPAAYRSNRSIRETRTDSNKPLSLMAEVTIIGIFGRWGFGSGRSRGRAGEK
jgi:hypothetical protein